MKYRQLNAEERSALAALRSVGLNQAQIARELGRHQSTVGRELRRNCAPYDGGCRSRSVPINGRTRGVTARGATASLDGRSGHGRKSGARSKCPGLWEGAENWPSVPRRFTGMCGGTCKPAGRCTRICAVRASSVGSGMAGMTAEGDWPGSGGLARGPPVVERRRRIVDWEIDTVMGESRGESSDCILTQERLRAHREVERADGRGSQPGAAGTNGQTPSTH